MKALSLKKNYLKHIGLKKINKMFKITIKKSDSLAEMISVNAVMKIIIFVKMYKNNYKYVWTIRKIDNIYRYHIK